MMLGIYRYIIDIHTKHSLITQIYFKTVLWLTQIYHLFKVKTNEVVLSNIVQPIRT